MEVEKDTKKKIGFFLINKPYTVYHTISIAIELAHKSTLDVYILCTERCSKIVTKILQLSNDKNITIKILRPHWYFNMPYNFEVMSWLRWSIFYKYRNYLRSFDAFVSPMGGLLVLKNILKDEKHIKYIFTDHGVQHYSYGIDTLSSEFDLFFLSGEKERVIREKLQHLTPSNHALTGYFKVDAIRNIPKKRLFDNNNPTVLFNPHWRRDYNSLPKFAKAIFGFFVKHPNYNLIFAPHVRLLSRYWWQWRHVLKYKKYPNILIDADSESSYDMTYTRYADIYVGDASSQVFEFILLKERPCIFLDANEINQDAVNRPLSWDMGVVVSSVDDFESELLNSIEKHKNHFKAIQTTMKAEMFHYDPDYTPSELAAQAVERLLGA